MALAYVGDAVYELYVRQGLVAAGVHRPRDLHRQAVAQVQAPAQAAALKGLLPGLGDRERDVVRRARNARLSHVPRASSTADYHASTALEALIGYLYLTGETDRLRELLEQAKVFAAGAENFSG